MRTRAAFARLTCWCGLTLLFAAHPLFAGPARVVCNSEPEGADVFLRRADLPEDAERFIGVTPLDVLVVAITSTERPYVLSVRLKGYHPWTRTITLKTDARFETEADLVPADQPLPPPPEEERTPPEEPEEEPPPPDETTPEGESDAPVVEEADEPTEPDEEPSPPPEEAEEPEPAPEPPPEEESDLVFVRADGLYIARRDGTGAARIVETKRASLTSPPDWSPDGQRIAYIDEGDLWSCAWDGSDSRRVVAAADLNVSERYWHNHKARCESPKWSPDGERMAFRHFSRDGFFNLYVVGADGEQIRLLQEIVGGPPEWSPDGSRIAVEGSGAVLILDPGDEASRRPVAVLPRATAPQWSPEGDRLAVTAEGELWACDRHGAAPRCLYSREGYPIRQALWLPGGEALVAVVNARRPIGPRWDEVWVIDGVQSDEPRQIYSAVDEVGSRRSLGFLGYQGNGERIVIGHGYRPSSFEVIDVVSGETESLLDAMRHPRWRADGDGPDLDDSGAGD